MQGLKMQTETELRNLAERYNYKIAKSEDGELTLHYDWDEGNVLAEGLEDIEDFILEDEFYNALQNGKLELEALWCHVDGGHDINENVLETTLAVANDLIAAVKEYRDSKKEC